jgi:small GTP-binding protein
MSDFSIGIVGLPNVGKSTLFKALTNISVEIAPYPFTTINPNIGIVPIPDERLETLAKIVKPERVTFATLKIVDIAGLIRGAHKGEGLGNQFLAQIRNCDGILMVIRAFQKESVENVLGEINPDKEIEILHTELLMKDLEVIENALNKLERGEREKETEKKISLLKKIKEEIGRGKLISQLNLSQEEKKEIKEYQFLTQKPIIYLFNTDEKTSFSSKFNGILANLKEEEEIAQLTIEERKELGVESILDKLIVACYNILNLIRFYTVAKGKEVRSWILEKGKNILEAAEIVHSDFKEKFIKAEIIKWEKLVEVGGWKEAKGRGLLKIVGKDYIVEDGDVIEFKI